jgi:hypothetical protein
MIRRRAFAGCMIVTWLLMTAFLVVWSRAPRSRAADFGAFYNAALLARTAPEKIFDTEAQAAIQRETIGRGIPLLFYHPPYELLPIIPLTSLSYANALLIWSAVQAGLLVLLPWLLRPLLTFPLSDLHLAIATFSFAPLWIALSQGQDTILLLLLITLAWRDLRSGRDVRAGFWLALGLFKFQIALPLAGMVIVGARRRAALGFVAGTALVVVLSAAVAGWDQLLRYPSLLISLVREHAYGTVQPEVMLNLRGLVAVLTGSRLSAGAGFVVVAVLSAAVAAAVLWRQRGESVTGRFAAFVAVAALVSYHLNPHDVAVLLVPILYSFSVAAERRGSRTLVALAAGSALYSPWTYLSLGPSHLLGMAAPLAAVLALAAPGRGEEDS